MGTQACHSRHWILVFGVLCIALTVASSSFAQEQPPQQNQPAPGGRVMRPQGAGGPMMQGMPGPGMMPGMGGPGMMREMPEMQQGSPIAELLLNPEVQKELGITPEQRKKLDDIGFNRAKEAIQRRATLQILRLELSRLINSENPDRAAIDKKLQDMVQEETALTRSSINASLDAHGVLTAEQRARLAQVMQNRMRMGRPQGEGGMQPGQPAPKPGPAREKAPPPAAPAKPPAG